MDEPKVEAHETQNLSPKSEIKLSKDEYFRVCKNNDVVFFYLSNVKLFVLLLALAGMG